MTEQQKQDKRVAELVAELRLYHHYDAADELERLQRLDVQRRLGACGGGEEDAASRREQQFYDFR